MKTLFTNIQQERIIVLQEFSNQSQTFIPVALTLAIENAPTAFENFS